MEPLISEVGLIHVDVFYKMPDLMNLIKHASNGPIQVIYHICNVQMDICSYSKCDFHNL